MKEEIARWMNYAEEDFSTAKANFRIKKYKFASFLCQQAAEKALKSVLLKNTGEIIKIHDLIELGKRADVEEKFFSLLENLTYVYVDTRYPDTSSREYTSKETKNDMKTAEEIIKWAKKNI